jgi:CBS domain-containing protein
VGDRRIPQDQAVGLTVGEVMIARPKTLPPAALVQDVRQAFENPSVRTVLFADGRVFHGAIERELLPADALADEPALRYADPDPITTTTSVAIPDAIELLDARAEPRLIVLDDDGATLLGLLCFNRSSSGFCVK